MSATKAFVVALAVVMPLTATTVSAQTAVDNATRRPYRGLFGAPPDPTSPHSLMLSGSIYGAYDDNELSGLALPTNTPWLSQSGAYGGANVGLDYTFSKTGQRFSFGGHLGGRLNYYHRRDRSRLLPSNQAAVTFGARLTRSLSFSAQQSASYTSNYSRALAPSFGGGLMDDVAALPDDAFDLFELRAIRTASTVTLSQAFGQYMSLTGAYLLRSVEVLDDDDAQNAFVNDYRTQVGTVGVQYSRPISRHATFVLGYGVRGTDRASSTGDPEILHNINGGVNYGRALSFSRRTSLSFATGSAVAVIDRDNGTSSDRRTRAFLTGNAALTHELGRTWTATLSYTRALRTWDEFRQLYFTQAVNAQIGGLLSRRMSLTGGASWADSSLQNQGGGTHRGYSANVRTQYALSRFLALYGQYVYYHYRFSDVIVIDARIPRELDRQGVRVGLTTSIPLLR